MFLRCNRRVKDGKVHDYWNVVENRRLSDGRIVRPEQLPPQRGLPEISLPPRPAGFEGLREPPDTVPVPTKMPRTAKYLGQVEWAWGPNNTRVDAYYLSTNREWTYWFLWIKFYDDNFSRWETLLYTYAARQGVPAKIAAIYLLLDCWKSDQSESEPGHFHWINNADFLSVEELHAIARVVWPQHHKE